MGIMITYHEGIIIPYIMLAKTMGAHYTQQNTAFFRSKGGEVTLSMLYPWWGVLSSGEKQQAR